MTLRRRLMITPKLSVQLEHLSITVKKRVWRAYLREFLGDLVSTFAMVTFLGMVLTWMALTLAFDFESAKLVALGMGIGAGGLACSYLATKEVTLFIKLRRDLSAGRYELLTAITQEASWVDLTDGREGIAVDCGDHTLVVIGGWWKNRQQTGIEWNQPNASRNFPSTHFTLGRLPESGMVVSIDVDGDRLSIRADDEECDVMDPGLDIVIPRHMHSYWINKNLKDISSIPCPELLRHHTIFLRRTQNRP